MAAPGRDGGRLGVGVLGAGRLGGDLVRELARRSSTLDLLLVADTDARAEGLSGARALGVPASAGGVAAILEDRAIGLVFDATTASAHLAHAKALRDAGRFVIDLTPAALGPYVVAPVNLPRHLGEAELSLVSSAAQATVPIARGLAWRVPLLYAEVITVLASSSVGPGARQDLDEATLVTARALEELGGARQAKAITILSPAEPPVPMRSTLRVVPEHAVGGDEVGETVADAVDDLARRLPGYRLAGEPRLATCETPWGRRTTVTLRVEITAAGAGNLDVMSSAAIDLGEEIAHELATAEPLAVPT